MIYIFYLLFIIPLGSKWPIIYNFDSSSNYSESCYVFSKSQISNSVVVQFKIGDKSRGKNKSGLLCLITLVGAKVTLSCFCMPSYSTRTCIGWSLISVKFVNLPSGLEKYPAEADFTDLKPLILIPRCLSLISLNSLVYIVSSSTATTWLVWFPLLLSLNRPSHWLGRAPGRPLVGAMTKTIPWPLRVHIQV